MRHPTVTDWNPFTTFLIAIVSCSERLCHEILLTNEVGLFLELSNPKVKKSVYAYGVHTERRTCIIILAVSSDGLIHFSKYRCFKIMTLLLCHGKQNVSTLPLLCGHFDYCRRFLAAANLEVFIWRCVAKHILVTNLHPLTAVFSFDLSQIVIPF